MAQTSCVDRSLDFKCYNWLTHYYLFACRVGLIEWIENTKPLKDFLQEALTEEETKYYG